MSHQELRNRLASRVAVPGAALVVFLIFAGLYSLHSAIAYKVLSLWGVHPPVTDPFLDLRYLFAVTECWGKGINVYVVDPCDPLGRLFGYSPLWLRISFLPSQDWVPVVGIAIDVLFLFSLAAFPPPQRRTEVLVLLVATLSPPVVFALQRANVDVVMFIMVVGAAALWIRRLPQRILSYAIVLVAGLLKFYPLVLLALAAREKIEASLTVFAIVGILLLGFAIHFYPELLEVAPNIPTGSFFVGDMFGARNLPDGLSLASGYAATNWVRILIWFALVSLAAAQVFILSRWLNLRRELARLGRFDTALLFFGAAIICGCFFAGQNVGYRGIFLLLPLPGLLALSRQSTDARIRRLAKTASLLMLFLLWQGVLTWNYAFLGKIQVWFGSQLGSALWTGVWSARELAWWFVVGILAGIFVCFVVESETGLWIWGRLRPRPGSETQ